MIDAPASASERRYLTLSLPAVYVEDDQPRLTADRFAPAPEPFVVRWMGGLEQTLDPIVTLLDNFAWHLDAGLSPDDFVRALLCWLGIEVAEDLEPAICRSVLRSAMPLGRARGTLAGLERLLELVLGDVEIRLTHTGGATQGADPRERPPAPVPGLDVECPEALTREQENLLRRVLDYACPAHVGWTLRIGAGGPPGRVGAGGPGG